MLATLPDQEEAFAAFMARDASRDGSFVVAVRSTGIYCKPSCAARRPRPENVEFFRSGEAARDAGYRPCLRCRPDDVARDREAVDRALALIGDAESPPTLDELAAETGYSASHFQRIFKSLVGVSPAAYARALRAARMTQSLDGNDAVTEAIYAAGYQAPSRAYADATARLGMTPSTWKAGGAGETIRYAVAPTSLGPMLVAATDKGLCRIAFDEDEAELKARFPKAAIRQGDADFAQMLEAVVALVEAPGRAPADDLPVDVRGTAFQQAVWQALRAIPPGETRSYSELAAMAGKPAAVRATGSACGDNGLAILIPCHRALRSDGSLGGYAYGLERKKELLKRERGA
jgi:AraC family transcriptional regulator of adaptative response/methylated-DNA-[protein]-cysteine methyltransferase